MVAHACNPKTLGGRGRWITQGQEFKTTLTNKVKPSLLKKKKKKSGWARWLTLIYNPSTLGGRGGWITRSRDRDHPGQQGETPSLLKIQKLAGHGGAHL